MLYKPSFCAECGEKIERTDWKLWTSRRFCELCETNFSLHEWLPKILGSIGFLSLIFIVWNGIQPSSEAIVEQIPAKTFNSGNVPARKAAENAPSPEPEVAEKPRATDTAIQTAPTERALASKGPEESVERRGLAQAQQNKTEQPVYFCGAETKKGSPCSRKVKGGGRCWQHTGHTPMLPQSQLRASQ